MLHKNALVGDNHILHNWSVADAAARLALVVAATDVGKACFQQDTKELYYLADTAPTWKTFAAATVRQAIIIACGDETSAVSTGLKVTFRMPFGFSLSGVRASLNTAQASGSIFTVDIAEAGVTILSTLLTIDNTEKTSFTAVAPVVISDTALADDAELSVTVTQIGDGTARGLKIALIGVPL